MDRPYTFFDLTNSICATCLRKVEAKLVLQEGRIFMLKRCPEHGPQRVLISTDEDFYKLQRSFLKPGQLPLKFNTPFAHGCPYDCGLCPDHEQHSCIALVEITDQCNLSCPVCFADSSPSRTTHRSLEQVERMLDRVVANEGEADVVQISGGEPSVHPQLMEILAAARERPIKHLMLNTNGIRIAHSARFAEQLARWMPRFEIYLQFDSLRPEPYRVLRGQDLLEDKLQALERLNALGLSTTLVTTVRRGLNDDELGDIVRFALDQRCVRGVTFQLVQDAGRNQDFDPAEHRLTLSEARHRLLAQHPLFSSEDLIPVPCHPDCLVMAYALKLGDQAVPLSGRIDPEAILRGERSTIMYEGSRPMRQQLVELFSTGHSPDAQADKLGQLLCCLPQLDLRGELTYENVFRVLMVKFLDPHDFDVRSVKRACVHIVHPDGRLIPFDTYNLFYRDAREQRLLSLRAPGSAVPLSRQGA
ncbi:MAG: radical SAM protein [Myxococcales bacterium]|nr:radical SAM protein [Myxococcales bacterium]